MTDPAADRDPVEELAEEFLARRRQGDKVSVTDYAEKHPQLARRIRDLFPTLLLMEEMRPDTASSRGRGSAPAQAFPPGTLQRLGDFRILREVGRGGMGIVYEAEQESLRRHVALKVLPTAWVASPTRLQRFVREAQAAARLHHTNIVPVFGVGQQDGLHYYVMQFIDGEGLDKVLRVLAAAATSPKTIPCGQGVPEAEGIAAGGTFSASEAAQMLLAGPPTPDSLTADSVLRQQEAAAPAAPTGTSAVPAGWRYWRSVARLGIQVADALHYAHQQGTLHRDIKPANLLMDNRGTVWVTDFGLAKLGDLEDLTHSGDMVGTLRYMAPEQFEGKADARSDVYNLGLTLYELLTLRPAFDQQDRRRLIRQMTQEEPPRPRKLNPAIPLDLETIVVKAMAGDPGHRYQTAGQLAADLRCFLEDRPIRARRITPLGRLWRWCRRNRAVAALTGTALALLLAVAVLASVGYFVSHRALKREELARRQAEAAQTRAKAERERAETNLRLATKAFEDIFDKVAGDTLVRPAEDDQPEDPQVEENDDPPDAAQGGAEEEDQQQWAAALSQNIVTGKDAVLLESMLKFYDQFARSNQADVKLQKETARAHRRVGDIQRRLGQYEKAEAAYRHALASYQALAKASPASAEFFTTIAAIDNELGLVLGDTGRLGEAGAAHRQALQTLQKEPPEVAALPESRFELAKTYGYLSIPLLEGGPGGNAPGGGRHGPWRPWDRLNEAAGNSDKAVEILTKLIAENPENPENPGYRLALARCQRDRYFLLSHRSRDESEQARKDAAGILESLVAKSPQNADYLYELAETYIMPSRPVRDGKPPMTATKQLLRAVAIGKELVARYPTVPAYRALLARCYVRIAGGGRGPRSAEALAQAEDALSKAVELDEKLSAEFPAVGTYRISLVRSLLQLASVQMDRHRWPQARTSLEAEIAAWQKMEASSPPMRHRHGQLGASYASLAKVLGEMGEKAQAEAAAKKAQEAGYHPHGPGFGAFHHEHPRAPEPK